jgi:transcriptional regulator with XRE-family HTH domain
MGNRPKQADTVLIDGSKIGDLRVGANLTQEVLASEVVRLGWHLSRGYLPSLENKPIARVHKQLAEALATALGVKVDDFKATPPQQTRRKVRSRRRMAADSPSVVQQNPPLEPSADSETILTRRRRGVGLTAPFRAEPPAMRRPAEATTIGQDIDAALQEEGLEEEALREEYDKLRQGLVSHVKQLVQLIKLAKGETNGAD